MLSQFNSKIFCFFLFFFLQIIRRAFGFYSRDIFTFCLIALLHVLCLKNCNLTSLNLETIITFSSTSNEIYIFLCITIQDYLIPPGDKHQRKLNLKYYSAYCYYYQIEIIFFSYKNVLLPKQLRKSKKVGEKKNKKRGKALIKNSFKTISEFETFIFLHK